MIIHKTPDSFVFVCLFGKTGSHFSGLALDFKLQENQWKALMPPVTIYTTQTCPYCRRAKELLAQKGVNYDEIDVTMDRAGFEAMVKRAHGGCAGARR